MLKPSISHLQSRSASGRRPTRRAGAALLPAVVAALLIALAMVLAASPVAALGSGAGGIAPTCAGGQCAISFYFSGGENQFVVPPGVTHIAVTAIGAAGAAGGTGYPLLASPIGYNGGPDGQGGLGGKVVTSVSVSPGQTLYVEVGGTPTTGPLCTNDSIGSGLSVHCLGGWNGGADGGSGPNASVSAGERSYAGGGGGASDLRTITRSATNTLSTRIVVAGGGGGGGGSDTINPYRTANGGASGGAADMNGSDTGAPVGSGGHAGNPAGDSAGGSSTAANHGYAGTLGIGGAGCQTLSPYPNPSDTAGAIGGGGGGGGGYFGGGGGGGPGIGFVSEGITFRPSTPAAEPLAGNERRLTAGQAGRPAGQPRVTGGGGGGGSSWTPSGHVTATPAPDSAQVRISWTQPSASTSVPAPVPSPSNAARLPGPTRSRAVIPLATTGSDVGRGLAVGAIMIALGGAMVAFTSCRRTGRTRVSR
ncbi:MAG: glycine-rich protein [Actinomycetota bacterium]|nr:glycine-rich protein [Actinomycetota bacterium]